MSAAPSRVMHARCPRGLGRAGVSLLLLIVLSALAGCATMRPDFEQPTVDVISVRPLPSGDIVPQFEIGLRVINPNATELALRGVSYKLLLNDYEVVTGVASELPVVPAYGETQFKLLASVSFIDGLRFVTNMMQGSRDDVDWRLLAKLDIGALLPAIRVEEKGTLMSAGTK